MSTRKSTTFDKSIGAKIRIARFAAKFSQKRLGEHVGVTLQQIQKYENGKDRVGAARLLQIAAATDFPISFFFDPDEETASRQRPVGKDVLADEGVQRLLAAVTNIKSPRLIKNLTEIAETFAASHV